MKPREALWVFLLAVLVWALERLADETTSHAPALPAPGPVLPPPRHVPGRRLNPALRDLSELDGMLWVGFGRPRPESRFAQ